MNRRSFMKTGASVTALGMSLQGMSQIVRAADEVKKIPLAVGLYSVFEEVAENPENVFKVISEIGYKGVEFAGRHEHKADYLRKVLDDNGLVCCGSHLYPIDELLGDNFKKTVEFNQILGNKHLILAMGLEYALDTKDGAQMTCHLINELVDKAAEHGMLVGYHTHAGDVKKVDGTTRWDRLFSQTNKEFIHQIDNGNCADGGGDAIAYVKRYPGRSKTVHLKPFERPGPQSTKVIGEDKFDWPAFLEACETVGGTEWYIVEFRFDDPPSDPFAAIKGCYEGLKKLGRA